ncbi:hypothetical protein N0M98_13305 [Paenibacillus doosanensis]|uniref:Chromosome partition protein Smc n=1 Tax=Paenibacillus konkukensis TaxID=2020716 RepID=A0ABY4RGP6_9BACL|nr:MULTISPECIES: hypothetical protein [Paenibacillus]MCS7461125.1 hypothetical protein [Paenibacillus doosanensis]UQZ81621.1 Chromosome partition protein Smc [Paenibacillus konkukensis]
MRRLRRLIAEQHGAVSIYLLLVLVPIFLFCALLIDFARIQVSEKEAENAVKTGVRSTLSSFSPALHAYGLYALAQPEEQEKALFFRAVEGNLSGSLGPSSFQFIDQKLEKDNSTLTSDYSLGSHSILKQQILEEMKYRAPIIYSLEIADKFKKTNLANVMGQASQFGQNAAKIEKLLEERDAQLDKAWSKWSAIYQKAATIQPFYETHLADLNALSDKVGIHTVEGVKRSIQDAKKEIDDLDDDLDRIDSRIDSWRQAGAGAAGAISSLRDKRKDIIEKIQQLYAKIKDWEKLLDDLLEYAKLLAALKLKSSDDADQLQELIKAFEEALNQAKTANDQLNDELRAVQTQNASSAAMDANQSFQSIHLISRAELDDYGSKASAVVATFSGLKSQLAAVVLFDQGNYKNAKTTLQSFWKQAQDLQASQGAKETERNRYRSAVATSKKEQRNKAQAYLDQATQVLGICSVSGADAMKEKYITLQGNPSKGSKGYYQAYLEANQAGSPTQPVPVIELDNADKAGASAMKLIGGLTDLLVDVRDEFYVDEFAVSKFSYRTLGLEKDKNGQPKASQELSQPAKHALVNQELEYLLYGAGSCSGNYSLAYAEMFAFRLAIGTAEALLEPKNEMLNVGSPLLVFLAAVAEGAMQAQQDMTKLVQGGMVPLSKKLGSFFEMSYKDYLRLFFLLHSRDEVMLARMQALIQLNTGQDLLQTSTYISGTATTSIKLWFLPGLMKQLGKTGLSSCQVEQGRCLITKTGVMAY